MCLQGILYKLEYEEGKEKMNAATYIDRSTHLHMPFVVLLQTDHAGVLIPQSATKFSKFDHSYPPLPPLPQVVVHLSASNLIS